MTYRIFVVDDHAVTRKGYVFLLQPHADLDVCGEAGSAAEALDRLPQAAPDLVIADIVMEGTSGIELIKQLSALRPDLPVLVVSMHDEALYAERALRAGACGYVMKSEIHAVYAQAIREVLRGGLYLSSRMNRKMLLQYMNRPPGGETSPLDRLTDRELETFELIGRGRSTSQIASALHISPKTVGTYRSRIKQKLTLGSSSELARRAALWVAGEAPDLATHDRQQASGARARRPAGFDGTRQPEG